MQHSRCRFCSTPLRHKMIDLGKTPLANSYVRPDDMKKGETFYPLCAYVCENCFLVQLEEFKTSEEIFSEYFYLSSFSETWLNHAKEYTDRMTERFGLNVDSQVIEIASNDGYLLQFFVQKNIPVLGIEPAANVARIARNKGIPTETLFWGVKTAHGIRSKGIQADLLIGNNVLAHVPNINDFVGAMKLVLKPHGIVTMEFPHLMNLIEKNQFDTIYHEHFSYFSFESAERIFATHGIILFDVEELPTHGGSLRIYGKHAEDQTKDISERVFNLKRREKAGGYADLKLYQLLAEKVRAFKRDILEFLIGLKREGKSIAGYGAPAKATTLLNYCGIGMDFLDYTVDRNPYKQGCFLPGVQIPIFPPEKILETKPDYLLILPWNIKDEIIGQMSGIRTWGGQFITLIPEIAIHP